MFFTASVRGEIKGKFEVGGRNECIGIDFSLWQCAWNRKHQEIGNLEVAYKYLAGIILVSTTN